MNPRLRKDIAGERVDIRRFRYFGHGSIIRMEQNRLPQAVTYGPRVKASIHTMQDATRQNIFLESRR